MWGSLWIRQESSGRSRAWTALRLPSAHLIELLLQPSDGLGMLRLLGQQLRPQLRQLLRLLRNQSVQLLLGRQTRVALFLHRSVRG